jgi:hypothetical protein
VRWLTAEISQEPTDCAYDAPATAATTRNSASFFIFFSFLSDSASGFASTGLITAHGGPVIRNAKVVLIFWGPSFATGGADHTYATTMQSFRNQFGTTGEYNVITQYYGNDEGGGTYGAIAQSSLGTGTADWFDASTPPAKCTDATVQSEVKKYLTTHAVNYATIYEVFIPKTSYSYSGGSSSCGGPHLGYCAYHSHYSNGPGKNVKYSIEPWAGCAGCQAFGNTSTDQEHFVCHETREAVTDPLGNAWYSSDGYEADDKCAWSPAPFTAGGYGYQYEWSNSPVGCVKTR